MWDGGYCTKTPSHIDYQVTTIPRWSWAAAFATSALLPSSLLAQHQYQPAAAFAPVIAELEAMRPVEDSSFKVHNFIISRDAATLTLSEGRMWPLTAVNGRTIGAVYQGTGRISYVPPTAVEMERVHEYLEVDTVDSDIKTVVLLFTDGTLDALYRLGVSPERADAPGPLKEQLGRARDYLKTYKDRTWAPAFLEPVLNGRDNGMFFALVERRKGEELIVQVDPDDPEPVTLSVHSRVRGSDVDPEIVASYHWTDRPAPPADARRREVSVSKYVLDANMPQQLDGGVSFSAKAECHLVVPAHGYGPWIPFSLYFDLDVDSVTWNGAPIVYDKGPDAYYLWVRAPAPLQEGETPVLTAYYHGDLLARYGDWFILKDEVEWYPGTIDWLSKSSFDITYHTPVGHPIGSVGVLMDSSTTGRMVTSHWVHEAPMRNASFNLGRFQTYQLASPGVPPITLLWSEAGHRAMARDSNFRAAPIAHVREVISDEAASAFRFFTNVYGPPVESHFYATEIPRSYGVAFPGLVHYSYVTFLPEATFDPPLTPGFNQLFRSHEVSHQWWGISVEMASVRDRWLSEGMAEFSGLWYMQTRSGSMEAYLGFLREYRRNIIAARGHLGAMSTGYRTGTGQFPRYDDYGIYERGAWTMHMLRVLMLQLSTMKEDKFTAAMREFYTTFRGRYASTDDLRRVMEKNAGADLGWFFSEWVDGTAVPTYTWAWHAEDAGGGQTRVRLRVKQTDAPDSFQMYVPVTVELQDGRMLRTRMHVAGPLSEWELPLLPGAVKSVKFNDFEGVLADVRTEGW